MQIADNLTIEGNLTATGALTVSGGATVNGLAAVAQMAPVQVSATSAAVGPAIPLGVASGATLIVLSVETVTAFTGATVSAVVGSTSGDASYVGATSIKNGGKVILLPTTAAGAAAFLSVPGGSGLVLTVSQGTPTSVGSATVQGIVTV